MLLPSHLEVMQTLRFNNLSCEIRYILFKIVYGRKLFDRVLNMPPLLGLGTSPQIGLYIVKVFRVEVA